MLEMEILNPRIGILLGWAQKYVSQQGSSDVKLKFESHWYQGILLWVGKPKFRYTVDHKQ